MNSVKSIQKHLVMTRIVFATVLMATAVMADIAQASGYETRGEIHVMPSSNNTSVWVIGGIPFIANHNTRYEDGLTFNTLTNQRVEAETYKVNNQYIASEIEAEDND